MEDRKGTVEIARHERSEAAETRDDADGGPKRGAAACQPCGMFFFMTEEQEKNEKGNAGQREDPQVQMEQKLAVREMAPAGLGPGEIAGLELRSL